jgi:hypothetical protein
MLRDQIDYQEFCRRGQMQQKSGAACAGMPGPRYGAKNHRLIDSATRLPSGRSHNASWSMVAEEMFGRQNRIDEDEMGRAVRVTRRKNNTVTDTRLACHSKGVCLRRSQE